MDKKRLTYMERLECYKSLGGFAGLVACLLAMILEMWVSLVEWWLPREDIDVVPDLIKPTRHDENGHFKQLRN
jgi:hypothetical protein